MKSLSGKKGIIMGVANDHSIAWGISQQLANEELNSVLLTKVSL